MSRYSIDDLLKLRDSPLATRPPNLPPVEEWMGAQDAAPKRPTTRGRQDDSSMQHEGVQKRSLLDPSKKLTTDPERIVLGPPRRSFASSTGRPFAKPGAQDHDPPRDKLGLHERNKTGEEFETRVGDRKNGAPINGRYNRHESGEAHSEKPRRRTDDDEGEGKTRREHDRHKWTSREADDTVKENGRFGFNRDPGRARLEHSWLRNDRGTEGKNIGQGRSWGRDRTKDGEWDYVPKPEIDPEWMDAVESAEPGQAHTQEDFQRWRERMKAGNEGESEIQASQVPAVMDVKAQSATPLSSVFTPDTAGSSMDKFFARYNDNKTVEVEKSAVTKIPTKTRFANLFGAAATGTFESKPELKQEPSPAPAVTVTSPSASTTISSVPAPVPQPGNADADQAGFQRILDMLGKRENSASHGVAEQARARAPLSPGTTQSHQRHVSPDLVSLFKQSPGLPSASMQKPGTPGLDGFVNPKTVVDLHARAPSTPGKDDLLLNLLRQAEIAPKPQARPPQSQYHEQREQRQPPGMLGYSENEALSHRQPSEVSRPGEMHSRGYPHPMFDDPAISSVTFEDSMRARDNSMRRPLNDDMRYESLRANDPAQHLPSHHMPFNLPQPPGFDQVPRDQLPRAPPGWHPQPQQHHLHRERHPGPPPGFGNHTGVQSFGGHHHPQQQQAQPAPLQSARPGPMKQQQQQPPPLPPPPQLPNSQQNRQPQRKQTGDSGFPSLPPGVTPSGFGAPPGFSHASAAGAAQAYGRYGMGGGEQGPPSNMGMAFREMYGNGDRNPVRSGGGGGGGSGGGVPIPPGFR